MKTVSKIIFSILFLLVSLIISANDDITATPTTIPLENAEILVEVQELLAPNEDCQLPCFWTFIPGETDTSDVEDFWQDHFDVPIEITQSDDGIAFGTFYVSFIPNNSNTDFSISMTFSENKLLLLNVSTFNTAEWLDQDWIELSDLISNSNQFIEYFIAIRRGRVILVYVDTQANILVQKVYRLQVREGDISPTNTNPLLLCINADILLNSELWILDENASISIENTLGNPTIGNADLVVYQPLEFMANLDSDSLSEHIIAESDDCLELRSYSEYIEMDYSF